MAREKIYVTKFGNEMVGLFFKKFQAHSSLNYEPDFIKEQASVEAYYIEPALENK